MTTGIKKQKNEHKNTTRKILDHIIKYEKPIISDLFLENIYNFMKLKYSNEKDLLVINEIITEKTDIKNYETIYMINCIVESFQHEPNCNIICIDTKFYPMEIINSKNFKLISCYEKNKDCYKNLILQSIDGGIISNLYLYDIGYFTLKNCIIINNGEYRIKNTTICYLINSFFDSTGKFIFEENFGILLINNSSIFYGKIENGIAYFEK